MERVAREIAGDSEKGRGERKGKEVIGSALRATLRLLVASENSISCCLVCAPTALC